MVGLVSSPHPTASSTASISRRAAATVFRGRPLTCPDEGQTRAVEHEMDTPRGATVGALRLLVFYWTPKCTLARSGTEIPFRLAIERTILEHRLIAFCARS